MSGIGLAPLCAATSFFTDLGTGQPPEHGLRTCLLAGRLSEALGVDPELRAEVFYVSLLRFLGCTADAHLIAALGDGDELGLMGGMAAVTMGAPREELARLSALVATDRPAPRRLRALGRMLTDPRVGRLLLEAHCEVGARLATDMGLPPGVATAIEAAYARWDGRGVPREIGGNSIPRSMRIAIVARDTEIWTREAGPEVARRVLLRRRGRAYDPEVVDAALDLDLSDPGPGPNDLWEAVLAGEPKPRVLLSGEELVRTLSALGDYADLKLPARTGYSRRVGRVAAAAAVVAALDPEDETTVVRAAAVHDLGIVAVPAGALGSLPGGSQWEQWRLHPHWTARALSRVPGLEDVAAVAGWHHERLDGSGYPAGVVGSPGRPAGLLACAVLYDELTRPAGSGIEAAAGLDELVTRGGLDPRDVNAVLGAVRDGRMGGRGVVAAWPAGLTDREVDVLRLLSRGLTNRQMATSLGISAKTVGAHVEHLYLKAGVRSRAAATLFAMRSDLID